MLNFLGMCSFVFVVGFTYYTGYVQKNTSGGQSPRSTIIEVWLNLLVGFTVAYALNAWVYPLVNGAQISHFQNFAYTWIFTAASMLRQYTIRRWFNSRIHKAALLLAGEKDA